jgi:arylsulfatase A-like enzyme
VNPCVHPPLARAFRPSANFQFSIFNFQCRALSLCFLLATGWLAVIAAPRPTEPPPNIVLIFCDDLGYADVGCYGAQGYKTPHIDRLARQGIRFTDFYVAQAVCSASRAALLTGCYPNRIGIKGALGPRARVGLSSNEVTLAELLRSRGYATAIYGKWHLGDAPAFLPTRHGFDEYFGLPYSNDMWPHHPTGGTNYPPLPLIEGEQVVQQMPDQTQLTTWYTERAVQFIGRNKDRPFFLYVPHAMPHVPLFVSEKFRGQSRRGLFGDVLRELDWSVGQILAALKKHRLEDRTLVVFTSDNGPWLSYGDHAGSTGGLREGKGTTWEGGVRVPFIARWPGKIPARAVCRQPAITLDLLPTLARLTGASLPSQSIDGLDIWPLLADERGARSPHDALYFYWDNELQALRSGPWKLHFPHEYVQPNPPGQGGQPGRILRPRTELALFHLERDPSESTNVAAAHPDVVARLQTLAAHAREELGDSATGQIGRGAREPGRVEAKPRE